MLENNDIPKETNKTHILGGRVGSDYSFSFYNPHNARFYFKFNKWNFKPTPELESCNYGHELKLESFEGCRIVIKKSQIEITNCINVERKFTISGSDSDRKKTMVKVASILELEVINVLKKFISVFGGTSDFVVISRRIHDNKILHDEIIDTLSLESQWNDDVSKKVYNKNSIKEPRNVEYKKEVYGQNYFRNAGLKAFAPEIESRLNDLNINLGILAHENKEMSINMTSHIPLVKKATEKLEADSNAVNTLVSVIIELKDSVKELKHVVKSERVKKLKEDWW